MVSLASKERTGQIRQTEYRTGTVRVRENIEVLRTWWRTGATQVSIYFSDSNTKFILNLVQKKYVLGRNLSNEKIKLGLHCDLLICGKDKEHHIFKPKFRNITIMFNTFLILQWTVVNIETRLSNVQEISNGCRPSPQQATCTTPF